MTTYRIRCSETDLPRPAAFGDHHAWYASRTESERVCRELSETGDWPDGHRPTYWVEETDEPAWEWFTGFDQDIPVGPTSNLFSSREEARDDAAECGYGSSMHLVVRRV